ncbi:transcriptional regulator [Dickeya dadantii]|nr:transcriptional regulator [Dickeya dadantii]NPE69812.1 transcriptional regulator [Dickeya dadantii]
MLSGEALSSIDLASAGEALYGQQWQSALARELDVDSRRIRHWMSGERPIPAGIRAEIAALCKRRTIALSKITEEITKTP